MSVEVYPNIYNVEVYDSVVYVPTALSLIKISEGASVLVNKAYVADTATGSISLVLPTSVKQGDTVEAVRFGVNDLTIDRNGHKINGADFDLTLSDLESARLRYVDATIGWIRF